MDNKGVRATVSPQRYECHIGKNVSPFLSQPCIEQWSNGTMAQNFQEAHIKKMKNQGTLRCFLNSSGEKNNT
jgi:hypothetical protein